MDSVMGCAKKFFLHRFALRLLKLLFVFQEEGKKPFKILQISDVHYDPLYTEGKSLDCEAPICCQPEQDNAKNSSDYCSKWSNYLNADTPKRTLEAVFEKASTYVSISVY